MNRNVLFIFSLVFCHIMYAQEYNPEYINSFKEIEEYNIVDFGKVIQLGDNMTKKEALNYVYNGDTARLYCIQEIFNMETEKTEGTIRELFLPKKCMRIDMENYYLIANTSYRCQDINELTRVLLTIYIIGKDYLLKDSIIAYIGHEYDYELTGLINLKNANVFLTGIENKTERYAKIFRINQNSLKFEIVREKHNAELNSENWKKELEKLDWLGEF